MKRSYLFAFAVAALVFAQPTYGIVLNPGRPITPLLGSDSIPLDTVLNGTWTFGTQGRTSPWVAGQPVFVPGWARGTFDGSGWGDETNQATFVGATPGGGSQATTVLAEVAGYAGSNQLWVYDPNGTKQMVLVFDGSKTEYSSATIAFKSEGPPSAPTSWDVSVDGGTSWLTGWTSVGGVAEMGFALYTPDKNWMYTDDSLNGGQKPQALVFRGKSTTGSPQWIDTKGDGTYNSLDKEFYLNNNDIIVGFEDLPLTGSSDRDYQDFVFAVDFQDGTGAGIPEPASLLVWSGIAALGAGGMFTRRRRTTRWSDENRQAIFQVIEAGRKR